MDGAVMAGGPLAPPSLVDGHRLLVHGADGMGTDAAFGGQRPEEQAGQ